jgi:hypothetical protein
MEVSMKKRRLNPAQAANKYACHLIKHLQMGFLIIAGNSFVSLKEGLLWKAF